jgi:hypothetical protein
MRGAGVMYRVDNSLSGEAAARHRNGFAVHEQRGEQEVLECAGVIERAGCEGDGRPGVTPMPGS